MVRTAIEDMRPLRVLKLGELRRVRARQDILDASFKIGIVPDLKGLMREDSISVLVQDT